MFPRAAVSLYPVNKFGTGRPFAAFLPADCLHSTDFFRETENGGEKQKAGMNAGLPQFAVESAQ
jgi:hypothetical protein